MFGFPRDLEESFLAAWQEPFTGFELRWLEVEICRQAMVPSTVADLFERMKSRYPDLEEMHQSKFYRAVSTLEESDYLKATTQGRAKVVQTTPAGSKELGRITRYFFEIQMERIKSALWEDIVAKLTQPLGDLLDQQMLVLGPEYGMINTIIYESKRLEEQNIPSLEEFVRYHPNFTFLDYNALLVGTSPMSVVEKIDSIDDWPYKAGAKGSVALLFMTLASHPKQAVSILKEAKRVVGEDGRVIVFELTKRDSKLISTLYREAMLLINFSNPSTTWHIPMDLPETEVIEKAIADAGLTIEHEYPDVLSSVYIVK